MQTWKERRTPPLIYLWDPGEVDPPASSLPRNSQIFKFSLISTFLSHPLHGSTNNITVLRPMFPNLRQSSTVHCSTCARSPYHQCVWHVCSKWWPQSVAPSHVALLLLPPSRTFVHSIPWFSALSVDVGHPCFFCRSSTGEVLC
jgi:hypothetical protein